MCQDGRCVKTVANCTKPDKTLRGNATDDNLLDKVEFKGELDMYKNLFNFYFEYYMNNMESMVFRQLCSKEGHDQTNCNVMNY